ncbi:MAG: AMP-binding protein [Gammaproteobacteria bacterium]|nr:AMP-binding protein [Gammaproteobacteria bacterium]
MEKVWLKNYSGDIPENIDPDQYSSLTAIIEEAMENYPQKVAFSNMGTNLTYKQLDKKSRQFASYLQHRLHLKKGARVALMMPNILQYPIALFGILRAGMVAVNVNPLYTRRELRHQLSDSGAEAIVILANFAHVLADVIDETPVRRIIITELADMCPWPKRIFVNWVIKTIKKMVPKFYFPHYECFLDALHKSSKKAHTKVDINHSDIAFLQYTGGTTGVSKGAVLTHKNMVSNVLQAEAWFKTFINTDREIVITALPLYHIFSLTANCLFFSKVGGLNVLITNPRDMPGFVKELKKWPFTGFTGVNTLFNGLLNTPGIEEVDFSHLKLSFGGGMAVQPSVAKEWGELTDTVMIQGYGLTETSPAAIVNPLDAKEFNGSIGLPISSTDVSIRDDNGNEVGFNEPGEVCIKGPQVMRGYWQRSDETRKVITDDGWFLTGDIGEINEEGYVKLVDRKKDMILVSGFNVFPNELEAVVAEHPDILEVAAIGIPDERSGEAVKLFIVAKSPSLSEDDVKAFCKENLTGYKRPKHIEFRDELPKSNVGKILRKDLRPKEDEV